MSLDMRVERPGQSQQRLSETAPVLRRLRFTLGTRRQRAQSVHQLAHLLTFVLHGIEKRLRNRLMRRAPREDQLFFDLQMRPEVVPYLAPHLERPLIRGNRVGISGEPGSSGS